MDVRRGECQNVPPGLCTARAAKYGSIASKNIKWREDDFSPQAYWAAKVTFAALMEDVVTP